MTGALKMPFTGGLPETGCGAGSTIANTLTIREALPALLRELGVETLLDAPCGDFNWLSRTDLSGVDYIGGDFDPEHCRVAQRVSEPAYYQPRSKSVIALDMCTDRLPAADLMLCRDFMQHLPNAAVAQVLGRFMASGIKWLLATSHDNAENADIAHLGMFRPLNLMSAPFSLSRPRMSIADGPDRILGLWHRDQMQELVVT